MNILVIDDDEQFLFVLSELLQKHGFDVKTASNGMSALRIISENSINLVISDTIMPDTPIMSFICTLKNSWPDIPVILISGLPGSPLVNNSMILGADEFLPKPLDTTSLFTVINKFKAA
jgi:DNA-binding NtrC family response regulator